MSRQRYDVPAPPIWPMAATFTLSLAVVAGLTIVSPSPAVGLGALAIAAFVGAWAAPVRMALGSGLIAWLFDDGFVEHTLGTLGFRAGSDLPAVALLLLAALLASALGRRHVSAPQRSTTPSRQLLEPRHG